MSRYLVVVEDRPGHVCDQHAADDGYAQQYASALAAANPRWRVVIRPLTAVEPPEALREVA